MKENCCNGVGIFYAKFLLDSFCLEHFLTSHVAFSRLSFSFLSDPSRAQSEMKFFAKGFVFGPIYKNLSRLQPLN